MLMLVLPNLLWVRRQPEGYTAAGENRFLRLLERMGEALVTVSALCFSDYRFRLDAGRRLWWLVVSFLLMLLYEVWWIRYFRSSRTLRDFYRSLFGIPVPGAALPVAAFFLLGMYGRVLWMLLAVCILGVGHIGIHLGHRKQIKQADTAGTEYI